MNRPVFRIEALQTAAGTNQMFPMAVRLHGADVVVHHARVDCLASCRRLVKDGLGLRRLTPL